MIRLRLTSGRGPGECRIALARTLGVLAREAESAGLDFDVATGPNHDGHGPASAMALLEGRGVEAFAATKICLQPARVDPGYFIGSIRNLWTHRRVIAHSERYGFGGRRQGGLFAQILPAQRSVRYLARAPIECLLSLATAEIGARPADWCDAIGSGGGWSQGVPISQRL